MSPDQEWFKARLRAIGVQMKEAAETFGLPPNKLWMMIAGERRVRPDEMVVWARVLRVPLAEIFRRFNFEWPPTLVPVAGTVSARGRVEYAETGEFAPGPTDEPGDMIALRVAGTIAGAGVMEGAHIYFAPIDRVDVAAVGRLSVVGLGDRTTPLVGVLEAVGLGKARVTVWGAGEVVESSEAISATPVRWLRAG